MRINTAADIEKLDKRIKEELGINVAKYRNEEVAEKFVELLLFPEYIITWVIRPILISFAIFILGFFVLDLVHIEYIIYPVLGLVFFILSGVMFGLLFLTWKMKADIWGIIDYSLDILKSAVTDLNQVHGQLNPDNRKDVLGLLFKGIIHIVTIPMMSKAITQKVPLVGGLVNRFVKKVLTLVTDMVKFDEDQLNQELIKKEGESNALQIYSNSINSVSLGLEKMMTFTFTVAQFPLKVIFFLSLFVLILFIYIIN